jgi:hypothetical protein
MTSSGENRPEPNSQLIQQLSAGIQNTSALIQGLLREIRENSLTLASFEGELSGLQRTVVSLNRVLQEGDGRESILTRVALLENGLEAIAKDLETLVKEGKQDALAARKESTALIKHEMEGKVKMRLGKLQTVGIVTPAVLAFILSLLALLRG